MKLTKLSSPSLELQDWLLCTRFQPALSFPSKQWGRYQQAVAVYRFAKPEQVGSKPFEVFE
jgi:hypothetical protein